MRPIVLTIAGSDPSAGAGIQADLKAIEASGAYAATAVTAITVQNTLGTTRVEPVGADLVRDQMLSLLSDLDVSAVKSGLIPDAETTGVVAAVLTDHPGIPYVLDPVFAGSDGFAFQSPEAIEAVRAELLPRAALVTPNVDEARILSGIEVEDARQAERAGARLLEIGARAVLVKGGHLRRDRGTDVLVTRGNVRRFDGAWFETPNTHGTGCVYSAAIAAGLALGLPLESAIHRARRQLEQAIRHSLALGAGRGPTDPLFALRPVRETSSKIEPGRLHVLTDESLQHNFSHLELARLAIEGRADCVQFREKRNVPTDALVATARSIVELAHRRGARVIVNDRVDVAAAVAADGIHLGRHDLELDCARRLLGPGILIGGTANDAEEARLRARQECDYIGVGPVFGTDSKQNPAPELGLDGLAAIARGSTVPLIAIGNITPERVREVLAAGAYGIAVLGDVALSRDPLRRVTQFRKAIEEVVDDGGRTARTG